MGISGISLVFIGIDFLNNLREENPGRAITHTVATATATTVGAGMVTTGLIYASAGTGLVASGAGFVTGFMVLHPVGWAVLATVGVGILVNTAYNNNFLGIKTIANSMGD